MPSDTHSRRRVLTAGGVALVGLAGCLSESTRSPTGSSVTDTDSSPETGTEPATQDTDGETTVVAVSATDFILYPLAGVHPHVHRRSGFQYVVVRTDTPLSEGPLRERLTLELDGEPAALAERQPVPSGDGTMDLAFAVSKDRTIDGGRVLFEQTERRTLSGGIVERLNNPPVFEVSDPSVAPNEIRSGERANATVRFGLRNVGEGRGTFGASLKGNFISGANTVTASLDAGAESELEVSTPIIGEGDEALVRLDWGSDEWVARVPVVGTPTESNSDTPTPGSG